MKIGKKVIYETIKSLLEKDDNLSDLLDSKNIAYLIPIEKGLMKELLPVEAIYNNKNPETTC